MMGFFEGVWLSPVSWKGAFNEFVAVVVVVSQLNHKRWMKNCVCKTNRFVDYFSF